MPPTRAAAVRTQRASESVFVSPSDPRIVYHGRWDRASPAVPQGGWSGVAFEIAFSGSDFVLFDITDVEGSLPSLVHFMDRMTFRAYVTREFHWMALIRWDRASPAAPQGGWSGVAFEIAFSGSDFVSFDITDVEGSLPSWWTVFIDGERRLEKANAVGVWSGAALLPVRVPERRIEAIGDSITCGFGNIGPNYSCAFTLDTEDFTRSFPTIAQMADVCWSGLGVRRNFGSVLEKSDKALPYYYNYTTTESHGVKWNYSYVPDAVIIFLGTNDFSDSRYWPSRANFTSSYVEFVRVLQSHSPRAHFFLLCQGSAVWCPYVDDVVSAVGPNAHKVVLPALVFRTQRASERVVAPSDSRIVYHGRWDRASPAAPQGGWSGVAFEITFSGSDFVSFDITDVEGPLPSWWTVFVDGERRLEKPNAVGVWSGGWSGVAFEIEFSGSDFVSFDITDVDGSWSPSWWTVFVDGERRLEKPNAVGVWSDATLLPVRVPTRKIEAIGDSITCGYGNLGANISCSFTLDTEDFTRSYSALVANTLNAQLTAVSWGGRGVRRNYGTDPSKSADPLPYLYKYTTSWNYSYVPDAVIIYLGTNDYSYGNNAYWPTRAEFAGTYAEFVQSLQSHSPRAHFFLLCQSGAVWCPYVDDVVSAVGANAHKVVIPDLNKHTLDDLVFAAFQGPVLSLSSRVLHRHRSFAALLLLRSRWRSDRALSRADVADALLGARCCMPETLAPAECQRCGGVLDVAENAAEQLRLSRDLPPDIELYAVTLRTLCTSSRTHLGSSMLVLAVDLAPGLTVLSERFAIYARHAGRHFVLPRSAHPCSPELVQRLLPLCEGAPPDTAEPGLLAVGSVLPLLAPVAQVAEHIGLLGWAGMAVGVCISAVSISEEQQQRVVWALMPVLRSNVPGFLLQKSSAHAAIGVIVAGFRTSGGLLLATHFGRQFFHNAIRNPLNRDLVSDGLMRPLLTVTNVD
eukprot:m51a1_g6192 putative acetylxylan esterase (967) ;mRNA; r:73629-85071